MKKLPLLFAALAALLLVSCQPLRTALDQYPPEYTRTLAAAEQVLGRHFTVTGTDRAHGVVYATSPVQANIYTKYRTTAKAQVFPIGKRVYAVEIRVTNELEVSEASPLRRGQPPYDWRAVGFDHVLEAALMTEMQAALQGRAVSAPARSTFVMFQEPKRAPARHRDLFRPGGPAPGGEKRPKTESKAPAPPPAAAPATPRHAQLYEQYLTLGDLYERRREHDKALLEYQRAATARPDSAAAYLSLASVFTALSRYDAAAAALRDAARAAHDEALKTRDVQRLRGLAHDVGQRVLLLKGWCKKNPDDSNARLLLGYHCILADRADEARTTLGHVLRACPDDPAAQYLMRQVEAL